MTGADIARLILDKNGLQDVKINESSGILSDHYDPRNKTVNLSPEVFCNVSVAAASVAAHECGHAIQDKDGYFFLRFRNSIIPLVNIASYLGYESFNGEYTDKSEDASKCYIQNEDEIGQRESSVKVEIIEVAYDFEKMAREIEENEILPNDFARLIREGSSK